MFNLKGVALPEHLVQALAAYLAQVGDTRSVDDVVALAVRAWLDNQGNVLRGYQWKSLFLPESTQLGLRYQGRTYVAQVRGDAIHFGGRSWSPRQWVMHVMGCVRNAWMEIWLRCPGDERWHLADSRRRLLRLYPEQRLPKAPCGVSAAAALAAHPAPPVWDGEERRAQARPDLSQYHQEVVRVAALHQASYAKLKRKRKRRTLRRDDMVREDQPDLRPRKGISPRRFTPGRPGPAERRKVPRDDGKAPRRLPNARPLRWGQGP